MPHKDKSAARAWRHGGPCPVDPGTPVLLGLLLSAYRYVRDYSENEKNHPQARDSARQLARSIKAALNT
jgi:hypothetical protein